MIIYCIDTVYIYMITALTCIHCTVYVFVYIYMYIYLYRYTYIYIYICIYICIYIYIYMWGYCIHMNAFYISIPGSKIQQWDKNEIPKVSLVQHSLTLLVWGAQWAVGTYNLRLLGMLTIGKGNGENMLVKYLRYQIPTSYFPYPNIYAT